MLSVKILEKKGPDGFFPGYSCQFHHNQRLIPSTDMIQLTLTLKMTTTLAVETSVTINNSPIQDYTHCTQTIIHNLPVLYYYMKNYYNLIGLEQ